LSDFMRQRRARSSRRRWTIWRRNGDKSDRGKGSEDAVKAGRSLGRGEVIEVRRCTCLGVFGRWVYGMSAIDDD
jgi:hypothetical protein